MTASTSTTYKTLTEAQVGFIFSVAHAGSDEVPDSLYELQTAAYRAIEAAFRLAGPSYERKDLHDDFTYQPYELCEECYELEPAEGCVELSVWFVSGSGIPLEDAQRLRALCEAAYQAEAGARGLSARYERAESHQAFRVTERGLYAGI